jgi:lysozyme
MDRRPIASMRLGKGGLDLIKSFEGFVPYPYDDLVVKGGKYPEWTGGPTKGTVTIGYGHTNLSSFPPKITPGLRMSEHEAETLLRRVLASVYEPEVRRLVKVPVTQGEYDSLVSFTYNVGASNLTRSTLLRKLNAGDYEGAAAEFDKWTSSKGTKLAGLVRRRNAEEAMFRGGAGAVAAGGGAVVVSETAKQTGQSETTQVAIGVVVFLAIAAVVAFIIWKRRGK